MSRHKTGALNRDQKKLIVIAKFGYRCNNPKCLWWDEETQTFGCRTIHLLQIDHINGDGIADRLNSPDSWLRVYELIQTTSMEYVQKTYQLLCANCNWDKKKLNKEHSKGWKPVRTIDEINELGKAYPNYNPISELKVKRTIEEMSYNPQSKALIDELVKTGRLKLEDK
jgi:hypothetical protein